MDLKQIIRSVPDFPKKGINFKDLSPIWKNPDATNFIISEFVKFCENKNITKVVGVESRGFIFAPIIANKIGVGFIPIRKKGKLPSKTLIQEYELEYGTDKIEIHLEDLKTGDNVLLHDDVLATGGTLQAAIKLIEKTGAKVAGVCCVIELQFLNGIENLKNYDFLSLVKYKSGDE
ncbi:MAG: adenine phosphoribosyltransferase [Bacteroidetes bacterium]|nr:adenine phosphoribosyltransferase [Bacteroidota bacterium]